ncbi:MAG: Ig-like domain-containing protein [Mycobacterium sp.]|nr:Ig-like domain-containing protein [Mycobacterium sp.]
MTLDRRTRSIAIVAAVLVVAAGVAAAVWLTPSPTSTTSTASVATASPTPASVTITPSPNARDVDPLGAVSVMARGGTLTDVRMINDQGAPVPGIMTPDDVAWKPGVALGYGRSYTVTAASRGDDGTPATQVSTFSTLTPGNQTKVTLTQTSGALLQDGGTYGVGTVIVAHFDESITDQVAAERRLKVTTTPAVRGSWYWVDDQNAHWRPADYYTPGTRIVVDANIYGAQLGAGLYGQEDTRTTFTIGDSHVSIADDNTKQITVFENGRVVRVIPTSMGMGGTETVAGQTLSFWTQSGTYTVMDKANPVIMDSSTYGLPVNSRLGYKESINYAVRLSNDGIYVHQLDSTVWAQGNTNMSHGCLNVNADNAEWFYDFSQPGDVFEVRNTGGEPLQLSQNGDWSVPWAQWLHGPG